MRLAIYSAAIVLTVVTLWTNGVNRTRDYDFCRANGGSRSTFEGKPVCERGDGFVFVHRPERA